MLETIDKMLESASGFLWGYVLIFALLGTHLYLTCLLRFPQRHFFTGLRLYFAKHGESAGFGYKRELPAGEPGVNADIEAWIKEALQ